MSDRNGQGRRLELRAALSAAWRGVPRLWRGAAGVLIVAMALSVGFVPDRMTAAATGVATTMVFVAIGALARLAITDDLAAAKALGLGRLGFQFGKAEARLLGAGLLCLLFLTMVIALLALVVLTIFGMAELDVAAIRARDWAAVGAPWKLAVSIVVGIGAVVVPVLLAGRLSLFVPATVGRGQMVSLTSMSLTAGNGTPVLAGLVVTSVPMLALGLLIGGGIIGGVAASVLIAVVLVGLQLPLTLGYLGAVYRQLED